MNNPVYLGLSILDISKFKMHEFWYDYLIPKYNEKARLCYMDTDNFIVHIETEDIYKNISEDVEKRFSTSIYEEDRSLSIGKNKKTVGLIKNELGGQNKKKMVGLLPKAYSHLKDNNDEEKKTQKRYKKVCCKKKT